MKSNDFSFGRGKVQVEIVSHVSDLSGTKNPFPLYCESFKMNPLAKPTVTERLLGLFLMIGAMMVLSALPAGTVLSLQDHFTFGTDWHWSVTKGAVIAIAIAVVGCSLFGIASFVLQRRRRTQQTTPAGIKLR